MFVCIICVLINITDTLQYICKFSKLFKDICSFHYELSIARKPLRSKEYETATSSQFSALQKCTVTALYEISNRD